MANAQLGVACVLAVTNIVSADILWYSMESRMAEFEGLFRKNEKK
jgi:hypothetical protein